MRTRACAGALVPAGMPNRGSRRHGRARRSSTSLTCAVGKPVWPPKQVPLGSLASNRRGSLQQSRTARLSHAQTRACMHACMHACARDSTTHANERDCTLSNELDASLGSCTGVRSRGRGLVALPPPPLPATHTRSRPLAAIGRARQRGRESSAYSALSAAAAWLRAWRRQRDFGTRRCAGLMGG